MPAVSQITSLRWGRRGIGARIEHCMDLADHLAAFIKGNSRLVLCAELQTGIVVWRPSDTETFDQVLQQLPTETASTTTIAGQRWFRNVATNPNANIDLLIAEIQKAL
jgi:L-2,4-diaminobutyrate decarboxylase